jgi:phosphonate transport system substrate-binding protein
MILRILTMMFFLFTGTLHAQAEAEVGAEAGAKAGAEEKINVAMTAAFVSEGGVDIYKEIIEYIEKKIGIKAEFVTGLSYSTVNSMIEQGVVQIAFICGYPYVLSHDGTDTPPTKLLVAPVMDSPLYKGKPVYYSYVIVHKDSPFQSFEQLKGKIWVYNDKISNSGYNLPRAKLLEINETNGFFEKVSQSGSHEESVRMVAEGQADASAVDSLVLDYMRNENEAFANDVRIIEKLGPSGIPPVVYSTSYPEEKAMKIRQILIDMKDDPEGQKILHKAYLKEFVLVDDALFDDIRKDHQMAVKANFMEIK